MSWYNAGVESELYGHGWNTENVAANVHGCTDVYEELGL